MKRYSRARVKQVRWMAAWTALAALAILCGPLASAVRATHVSASSIEFVADNDGFSKGYHVSYRGGELYPHLVRIDGQPDVLNEILKSLTPVTSAKQALSNM